MKLRGSTKSKIIKDKNSEKISHLGITEVVLMQCKIVNIDCQHHWRVLMHLFLINHLVSYYIFHPRILIF